MSLSRGYQKSAINEQIRDDENIRKFVIGLINADIKRGKTLYRIASKIAVNRVHFENYYRYSSPVFHAMYDRSLWIRATAIRKILNYYGYDLSPVIVEKQ